MNLIIGKKSNLTKSLVKHISNCKVISLEELDYKNIANISKNQKINIIINQFYPANKLSTIEKYEDFYNISILKISKFLDNVNFKRINKIIYSSSSSVYGSIGNNHFNNNRDLYSSAKLVAENLIVNFCQKKNIKYILARIFNMYGDDEDFSIISKILKSIKENKPFFLYNNGESIRDFIHVTDVSKIYKKLIDHNFSGIVDVGSGFGIKIIDLINSINKPNLKIKYDSSNFKEIGSSIANRKFIFNEIGFKKFITLEDFFLKKKIILKIDPNKKIPFYKKNHIQKLNNYEKILNTKLNYNSFFKKKEEKYLINFHPKRFKNQVILITGAGGSIGSNLVKELSKYPFKKILLLDHDETALFNIHREFIYDKRFIPILMSLNDYYSLKNLFKKYKITHLYHSAAYKHVDMLEKNIKVGILNNIFCTLNLVKCINSNVKSIVIISTDKATKPESILGMTKRISEIVCQNYIQKFNPSINLSIVRFGNVFGSQGSLIEILINKLKNSETINITSKKAERFFMSIQEACKLVITSTFIKSKKKILTFDMGKSIKINDLVTNLIQFMDLDPKDIKIKFTGLKKGEKIKEELSISKNKQKTKFPKIMIFSEPLYSFLSTENLINELYNSCMTNNDKKSLLLMKNFLIIELVKN
jgi:nucleoside-diphosphate-sugar epimerase